MIHKISSADIILKNEDLAISVSGSHYFFPQFHATYMQVVKRL